MQTNLKNFPTHELPNNSKCFQWKEAFEKELRETLDWLDKWHPRTPVNKATKESWKHTIQEILGEHP